MQLASPWFFALHYLPPVPVLKIDFGNEDSGKTVDSTEYKKVIFHDIHDELTKMKLQKTKSSHNCWLYNFMRSEFFLCCVKKHFLSLISSWRYARQLQK